MSTAPNLLFISPVMPAPAGNGLAMRAAMSLEALSRAYSVHLLVVPVVGEADPSKLPRFVKERAARTIVQPVAGQLDPLFDLSTRLQHRAARVKALIDYPRPALCSAATPTAVRMAASSMAGAAYQCVHVMRLYMAPFATHYLQCNPRPVVVLDLDDDEVRTRQRLSTLHARNGELDAAQLEAAEADKFAALEVEILGRFDRLLVASDHDRSSLAGRTGSQRIAVVPNAARVPEDGFLLSWHRRVEFILVGTMGYYPNADGARYLCEQILPLVRAGHDREVRCNIVGRGPPPAVRALGQQSGVFVRGAVGALGPYYRRAAIVVIPLRAGGGTRIKLLEAMACGKPIVTTTIGAKGIEVEDGRHVLVADTPQAFAAACLRLLRDRDLCAALGARGRTLTTTKYAPDVVAERLLSVYRTLG